MIALRACDRHVIADRQGAKRRDVGTLDAVRRDEQGGARPRGIRPRTECLACRERVGEGSLLDAACQSREPLLLFNGTPNRVEARVEGGFVTFPDKPRMPERSVLRRGSGHAP